MRAETDRQTVWADPRASAIERSTHSGVRDRSAIVRSVRAIVILRSLRAIGGAIDGQLRLRLQAWPTNTQTLEPRSLVWAVGAASARGSRDGLCQGPAGP